MDYGDLLDLLIYSSLPYNNICSQYKEGKYSQQNSLYDLSSCLGFSIEFGRCWSVVCQSRWVDSFRLHLQRNWCHMLHFGHFDSQNHCHIWVNLSPTLPPIIDFAAGGLLTLYEPSPFWNLERFFAQNAIPFHFHECQCSSSNQVCTVKLPTVSVFYF